MNFLRWSFRCYNQHDCHVVFDIKMGSLRRKCRYVAGGHMTDPPAVITSASVVSRESVRITFTIAALNGHDVMTADIMNAYLTSPCDEQIWTTLRSEFGPELAGKRAIVVRSLYGLKSAGAAYRYHLATCMEHLGFGSCKADPDVWLRENSDHTGARFWEYVLIYTDDILVMGKEPKAILDRLNKYFTLKEGSVGEPSTSH
jgi:Reverse transcriptase (RNA-dependent DNA polymerase)